MRFAPYIHAFVFVSVWVGLGLAFRLGPNEYLLVGIPLTVAFQLLVRRRPIRDMWVRSGPAFRLSKLGALLTAILLVAPVMGLVDRATRHQWIATAWHVAAIVGAFGAAYALCQFKRATYRELLLCLATAGVLGAATMIGAALYFIGYQRLEPDIAFGVRSLLLYFPVSFVLEEVSFRGVLDAHVHRPQAAHGWWSAFFVSVLWGLWHWPLVSDGTIPWWVTALRLVAVHSLVGVPLSIFWRRSGNLAVPAAAHAFIDAVRNALLHA